MAQETTNHFPTSLSRCELERYRFAGWRGIPGECGLLVARLESRNIVVLFSQLPDQCHVAITNSFEDLAIQLYRERLSDVSLEIIRWYQHYPQGELFDEHIDEVILEFDGSTFRARDFLRLSSAETREFLALIDK